MFSLYERLYELFFGISGVYLALHERAQTVGWPKAIRGAFSELLGGYVLALIAIVTGNLTPSQNGKNRSQPFHLRSSIAPRSWAIPHSGRYPNVRRIMNEAFHPDVAFISSIVENASQGWAKRKQLVFRHF